MADKRFKSLRVRQDSCFTCHPLRPDVGVYRVTTQRCGSGLKWGFLAPGRALSSSTPAL